MLWLMTVSPIPATVGASFVGDILDIFEMIRHEKMEAFALLLSAGTAIMLKRFLEGQKFIAENLSKLDLRLCLVESRLDTLCKDVDKLTETFDNHRDAHYRINI